MAATLKQLAQAQVSTTATTVYTVPASTTALVKELIFANTSNSLNVEVTVYFVKSGDTVAVKNTIIKSLLLLPTETQIYGLSSVLPTGTTIKVSANLDAVIAFQVSGMEVS